MSASASPSTDSAFSASSAESSVPSFSPPTPRLGAFARIGHYISSAPKPETRSSNMSKPHLVFKADTPLTAFSMDPVGNRAVLAGRGYMRVVSVLPDEIVETADVRSPLQPSEDDRIGYVSDMKWCAGPYSSLVATASTTGFITLYSLESRAPQRLSGHTRTVNSLALSKFNPHLLVSGGLDMQIKFWDLRVGRCVANANVPKSTRRVQLSPSDSNKLCAVFDNGWLLRWDTRKLAVPDRRIAAHNGPGFCCDYHPTLDVIATGGRDRAIRVWDMRSEPARSTPTHEIPTAGAVSNVLWRKNQDKDLDDCEIASSSLSVGDYRIQVWNLRRKYIPSAVIDFHDAPVTALAWAPPAFDDESDESYRGTLWACSRDERFVAHDVARSCPQKPVHSLSHQAFAWGPNDEFAFVALDKKTLRPDGLVDETQKRGSVMRMMLRRATSVPVVPSQYVASSTLAIFNGAGEAGGAGERDRLDARIERASRSEQNIHGPNRRIDTAGESTGESTAESMEADKGKGRSASI